jgi:uncharacterized membrane protein YcaP (DUF421 family)
MDAGELVLTAARAVAVYGLMLVVIRAFGKRTIGNFAAFDLIVALMLGELVDEIIYGDVAFLAGPTAIVAIGAAQAANAWLTWWDHGFDRLLEGTPTIVVRNGALDEAGMKRERMNGKDVMVVDNVVWREVPVSQFFVALSTLVMVKLGVMHLAWRRGSRG